MATTASYHPSEQLASKFWETQFSKNTLETQVPEGFPEKLNSPLVWTREEIEKKRLEWILKLEHHDVKALEAALAAFEGTYQE